MNNWTPDRPTKPGRYEVCFGPPRGIDGYRVWVVEVWREHPSKKLFAQRGILDIPINPDPDDIDTLTEALWRPYVEPPDPFAELVPQPSEFKAYRLSDDAKTPNLRLILDVEPGEVVLYEADMTSRSATAKETAVHDRIIMSPADARWLRDALQQADLSDPPEVTSAAPVPSLRERVEGLPTYDIDGEVWSLSVREVPGGEYLKRSEVLVLVDEVTR